MNTCVIEALYPEVCNLFGDTGNLRYLKLCLPQATFIETALNDEPYFVHHPVSMIYLGPMSEHTQCTVISKLAPYRERIAECIANGVTFLATGNAMEVFGKQITDAQSSVTTGLGLIDHHTGHDAPFLQSGAWHLQRTANGGISGTVYPFHAWVNRSAIYSGDQRHTDV